METMIAVNKGSQNTMPLCRQVNVKMQRVLVVDDDKVIRDVLSTMLMTIGFGVDVASRGDEGLNLFRTNLFDLVVTDLKMPGMDGWTLSYYIKDEAPDTPVVLITGLTWEHVKDKLRSSCVDSVMFKPFGFTELKNTVQGLLSLKH